MKALEILKHKWIAGNVIYDEDTDRHTRYLKYDDRLIEEAIKELEERQKEDEYIYQNMKESLSMGNKAQSLSFVEVYQIINKRLNK